MTLDEFQQASCTLYGKYPYDFGSFFTSLGIVNSTGNLAGYLMNILNKSDSTITEDEKKYIGLLLGEIMTYISLTANALGISMEYVGEIGISKLKRDRETEEIKTSNIFRKHKIKYE